ncbi:MAG TPA: DUF692 domain-containing protein [Stellaceae bacterium]|nr:DUF692 domain-containing protein [Stellaceae bacterium]
MAAAMRHSAPIPARTGIGLRGPHIAEVLATRPAVAWLELHPENYMSEGPGLAALERVRRDYPLSLHGVGLSLGSAEGIDRAHLARLRRLVERLQPGLVSEHLSWSVSGGVYLNDLLPLPLDDECLAIVARNVEVMQEALGRRVLVENPSAYLRFRHSTMSEPEFLTALARKTGCGLLCDVNNIYVSAVNCGGDPRAYLAALPAAEIGEIHLAGHFRTERQGRTLLIDDHGSEVSEPVWGLYAEVLQRFGAVPTLIEWDREVPPLDVLMRETARADAIARELREGTSRARVA